VLLTYRFLEKALEFLYLVASGHFIRFNVGKSRPFISHLLPFTFGQRETVFYYESLEIWKVILNHLIADVPFINTACSREDTLECFKEVFLDLAIGIVTCTTKFNHTNKEEYFEDEVSIGRRTTSSSMCLRCQLYSV
jgi:hypothetical protein